VGPNPSIERTSTGMARETPQVHVPLRGPSRFRLAHVKRYGCMHLTNVTGLDNMNTDRLEIEKAASVVMTAGGSIGARAAISLARPSSRAPASVCAVVVGS
jgi:hypothetical protein